MCRNQCRPAANVRRVLCGLLFVQALTPTRTFAQLEARPPVTVRLYPSLLPGIPESRALGTTRPMVELLSTAVDYPLLLDLEPSATNPQYALFQFGRQINEGKIHLGVLWGLELAWLAPHFPQLEPLAVVNFGGQTTLASHIIVRRDSTIRSVRGLEGKRQATYAKAPLMDHLALRDILLRQKVDPSRVAATSPFTYPSVKHALQAVRRGDSDYMVVSIHIYARMVLTQPALDRDLTVIANSSPYPPPVVVGLQRHIDRLRNGLWSALQRELSTIHNTPDGEFCIQFWRFQSFLHPDQQFMMLMSAAVRQYPLQLRPMNTSRPD